MPPLCSVASAINGFPMTMVATRLGQFHDPRLSIETVTVSACAAAAAPNTAAAIIVAGQKTQQSLCDAQTRPT